MKAPYIYSQFFYKLIFTAKSSHQICFSVHLHAEGHSAIYTVIILINDEPTDVVSLWSLTQFTFSKRYYFLCIQQKLKEIYDQLHPLSILRQKPSFMVNTNSYSNLSGIQVFLQKRSGATSKFQLSV